MKRCRLKTYFDLSSGIVPCSILYKVYLNTMPVCPGNFSQVILLSFKNNFTAVELLGPNISVHIVDGHPQSINT